MRYIGVVVMTIVLILTLSTVAVTPNEKEIDITKFRISQSPQVKTVRLGDLIYEYTYKSRRIRYFYCGILFNSLVIKEEIQEEKVLFPAEAISKTLYVPLGLRFAVSSSATIQIERIKDMEAKVTIFSP